MKLAILHKDIFLLLLVYLFLLLGLWGSLLVLMLSFLLICFDRNGVIKALTFILIIQISNPVLFNGANSDSIVILLKFILIAFSFCVVTKKFLLKKKYAYTFPQIFLFILLLMLFLLSILSSKIFDLSLFKLLSFSLGSLTIFGAYRVSSYNTNRWVAWLLANFTLMLVFSYLVYPLDDIVYARLDGRVQLYQGILNHPQTLSVILSPYIAFFVIYLLNRSRISINYLILAVASIILLTWSKGRTGMVSIALAFFFFLLVKLFFLFIKNNYLSKVIKTYFTKRNVLLIFISSLIFILNFNDIKRLVFKRNETSITEALIISRENIVKKQLDNINTNFFSGIGFGIPSYYNYADQIIVRDPLFGIPIAAPVEKGFLPIAILEETGFLGVSFFVLFVITLFWNGLSYQDEVVVMCIASFFTNFGEMSFFSFGGLGLHTWLIIGLLVSRK